MSKILGYCMKTKKKGVTLVDAEVSKTAKGGYMAKGHDGSKDKNKMCVMLSEANALAAVKSGDAVMAKAAKK